uniref:Glycosyltransferase subfamily 4-like N-terminal domain-containing protein n=1 Tax=Rhodosorus marinus TaxID=101924 RepID=A0A7S0G354_9RHOD|mmetsp:Transcript_2089/g.3106  ORF Transcript_2089/g.3106 Transcript_2089/m.3106 type:complete len:477 (+) Transcript_2089:201-1631(+)|eukprot:CAMPEP_0184743186 /NCGR_PEP_ID=MMETSP0315-20130426/6047_1 /TAXON_ID=101924 /ORGANISM="Rhodosorus marinus, Strain UTEX LB 2760" /LENGTH=476 /DNA_ID=CAMNT_0027214311 /DNA_START=129 /DNA_END=1559 /DNA_ORIENTATION=+
MVGFVLSSTAVVRKSRVGRLCEQSRVRVEASASAGQAKIAMDAVEDDEQIVVAQGPRKRIAIVVEPTPFTHVSGYSNRFKTHIEHLTKAGDDVLIICPDTSENAPSEYMGAKVQNVPGFKFPLYDKIMVSFGLWGVYPTLRDFNPDIIHLSTPGLMTISTLVYARLLRKPLICSYHTHLPHYAMSYGMWYSVGLAWWLIKVCHNRADATLATSPQLCNELRQQGVQRVGLWPKGVNTIVFNPKFKNEAMRSRLSEGNPQDNLLIYVGRLGAEKNLQALKAVLAKLPTNTRLAFVGDGPYRTTLEELFAGTKTYFAGLLQGEELSKAFASADVFVMPSESETLGFVVMESMASGVPVVGARAGGIPDLIQHEKTGYLFEPGNTDQIVDYVRKMLYDTKLRETMSKNARSESEKWSWKASTSVTRNFHYGRATSSFKFRALWGLGLPRSLSWFRWIRRRIVMLLVLLTQRVKKAAMQY